MRKITGMKELQATLAQFDKKFANNVVKKSLRAGAKLTQKAIQADAKRRTGKMADAFVVTKGRVRKGIVTVMVEVAKRWFVGDLFYAGFINFGWHAGRISANLKVHYARLRKGKKSLLKDVRREIPGTHFVETAASATADAAMNAIVETTRVEVEKAVAESKG